MHKCMNAQKDNRRNGITPYAAVPVFPYRRYTALWGIRFLCQKDSHMLYSSHVASVFLTKNVNNY